MKSFDAINAPPQPAGSFKPKRQRRWLKYSIAAIILLLLITYGGERLLSKTNQIFANKKNVFVRFGKLIVGSDQQLIGEDQGQINVLLLGIGGIGHEGPLLTDTMIVASLNPKTSELILTSIPRDFVIGTPSGGFEKINAAYAYAEQARAGGGGAVVIAVAEKVTGFKIPYYAVVDFNGFKTAVDHVGGVDVTIDRTFRDAEYPDYKEGYLPPLTFTKGVEHMNGERALQFARSRHGNNGEGSDFARSERQKKIILALKEKVVKLNLTDLRTINNLLSDFTQNFRTNLEPYEIKRFAELGKNISPNHVYSLSLAPQGDLICAGLIDDYTVKAYVVQPCEGKTLADIHQYLSNLSLAAKLKKEDAIIEIQNSTGKAYVLDSWRALSTAGLDVNIVAFKGRTPYDRTIIYNNSNSKPNTIGYLKDNFNFTLADVPYANSSADIVIILGKDAL